MKRPPLIRILLQPQDFLAQCLQVVDQVFAVDVEVVFEKLEQYDLHFIEIPHFTEEPAYLFNKMLQQIVML